jgi:hypothetical protein
MRISMSCPLTQLCKTQHIRSWIPMVFEYPIVLLLNWCYFLVHLRIPTILFILIHIVCLGKEAHFKVPLYFFQFICNGSHQTICAVMLWMQLVCWLAAYVNNLK